MQTLPYNVTNMAESKEPEIYERLRSLEIVDLDPNEFPRNELVETLTYFLRPAGVTAADLEKPLNEENRLATLGSIDKAVVEIISGEYQDRGGYPAVTTLIGIRSLSSLLMSATRLKDMEAGPATAYYDGRCSKEHYFMRTLENVSAKSPQPTNSIRYENEGGPLYYVCCTITRVSCPEC